MDHSANRGEINGAMEHLPALSTEAADPACRGSNCQWQQQQKTQKAHGDERALGDIFPDCGEIKGLIEDQISQEVDAQVGKSEEAEHAAKTNQVRQIEKLAERRDAKSEHKETERPAASGELNELDRVSAEAIMKSAPNERSERN